MTIKELRERQLQLTSEARAKMDEITDKTDDARAAEINQEFDAIMAEHDKIEARVSRELQLAATRARLDEVDESRTPALEDRQSTPESEKGRASYDQAFRSFLQNGARELPPELRSVLRENRAQSVGTDSAGGYTVPQGFLAELIKSMAAWGPMLDPGVTRQLTTATGNQLEIPTMDDTGNVGAILAENTQDSEQDITFGQKVLDAYKYTTNSIRVSEELLQDSAFDLEGHIREVMTERLGRIVNTHLTTGTGSGQPNGIATASAAGVVAASTTAIAADELLDLEHSVDPAYRASPNVRWMFHDTTLKVLRKLKDGDGNYLWQPADLRAGAVATLLNYPYEINQAVATGAANARTILFGDMSKYVVRRVREMAMKRLVERYADFHQVGFIGFARYDGDLLDTAAVKHLAQAAS